MIDIIRFPAWLIVLLCAVALASLYVVAAIPLLLWTLYSGTRLPDPGTPCQVMMDTFERLWPRNRSTP